MFTIIHQPYRGAVYFNALSSAIIIVERNRNRECGDGQRLSSPLISADRVCDFTHRCSLRRIQTSHGPLVGMDTQHKAVLEYVLPIGQVKSSANPWKQCT